MWIIWLLEMIIYQSATKSPAKNLEVDNYINNLKLWKHYNVKTFSEKKVEKRRFRGQLHQLTSHSIKNTTSIVISIYEKLLHSAAKQHSSTYFLQKNFWVKKCLSH